MFDTEPENVAPDATHGFFDDHANPVWDEELRIQPTATSFRDVSCQILIRTFREVHQSITILSWTSWVTSFPLIAAVPPKAMQRFASGRKAPHEQIGRPIRQPDKGGQNVGFQDRMHNQA